MDTYPIFVVLFDSPLELEIGAALSFAPLQKPHRNHRSNMWLEALSGMVIVLAKKGIVLT